MATASRKRSLPSPAAATLATPTPAPVLPPAPPAQQPAPTDTKRAQRTLLLWQETRKQLLSAARTGVGGPLLSSLSSECVSLLDALSLMTERSDQCTLSIAPSGKRAGKTATKRADVWASLIRGNAADRWSTSDIGRADIA
jgi:hypothetical protein